mgnify:CR=1 FL=1
MSECNPVQEDTYYIFPLQMGLMALSIVLMLGKLAICRFEKNITTILGLLAIYCYSICLHAYNKSVFWELFFHRWGYRVMAVDRERYKRKKARIIAYGKLLSLNGLEFFFTKM